MAVQLLTVAAYARHRGCDEKAVRKAIAENRITALEVGGKRMIDPAVADIQWAQNTRARADSGRAAPASSAGEASVAAAAVEAAGSPDPALPGADAGYSHYRRLEAKEDLKKKQRENMVAEGLLVERKRVDRAVFDAFRALRDKAMAVGQRASPRCIGLADARDIEHVINEEIRRAFEGWEEQMQQKLPPPPEAQS